MPLHHACLQHMHVRTLPLAPMDESSVPLRPGCTYGVQYASTLAAGGEAYKLLSVPPAMLTSLLSGDAMVVKGAATDDLVLCTHDTTYMLTLVESSNTLYLTQAHEADTAATDAGPSRGVVTVQGYATGTLEVRPRRMRTTPCHTRHAADSCLRVCMCVRAHACVRVGIVS
ncbi:DUF2036 domain-containing protein [archaeon]|nr:MAG: DUF2036 domain-containing protein [archaeon]